MPVAVQRFRDFYEAPSDLFAAITRYFCEVGGFCGGSTSGFGGVSAFTRRDVFDLGVGAAATLGHDRLSKASLRIFHRLLESSCDRSLSTCIPASLINSDGLSETLEA